MLDTPDIPLGLQRFVTERDSAAIQTIQRGLLDEIRGQLAEEFPVTGGMPVAEVAQRLGYAEVSGFSRAFRRWKSVGPREFRARQLARR